jgi:hypothetical protein
MNLLDMMKEVAKNASIAPPQGIDSTDPDHILMVQFLNDTGDEVARRVDWGILRQTETFMGTGSPETFSLPDEYARMSPGLAVISGTNIVRGSLTADEWLSLAPIAGDPRYFYLTGKKIAFYPYLRAAVTAQVLFQSAYWAESDVGPQIAMESGEDRSRVPDELLIAGAVWRWRRHVGKDYADYVAEFEGMLSALAASDGGVRSP